MYSFKNGEGFENLEELASLKKQIEEFRLQDKLGKHNFHQNLEKRLEPITDTIKDTSDFLTKTFTETSIKNSKALEKLNEKVLEVMNDKGMIAPYSALSLVNLFKPENKSQFKLIKELSSTDRNDFLIKTSAPVTLYSNMLTFRDSKKSFKLVGIF